MGVVQRFVSEVGVAGSIGPTSLTIGRSQDGINRVIEYVQQAHATVCWRWPDWDFLWGIEEGVTTATQVTDGATVLPAPDPPAREYVIERSGLQVERAGSWRNVRYMDWRDFKSANRIGNVIPASTSPASWTVRPDRMIELSSPIGGVFNYRYEYYKKAALLVDDSDPIIVPDPRIVLVQAKMIFAERENAPEIMHGSSGEYDVLMTQLESTYLPGFAGGRSREERLVASDD